LALTRRAATQHTESMRIITAVKIGPHGYVTALRGDDWPMRTARHVVEDIELGLHSYAVKTEKGRIHVYDASDAGGRYLRADNADTGENVLLSLPSL
jgi:hypothetical protein